MDWLNIAQVVGGVATGVGGVLDPYFYTDQEKAADGIKTANATTAQQQVAAQDHVTAANLAIAQGNQALKENVVKYTLLGVLGVGGLFLASQLIREK